MRRFSLVVLFLALSAKLPVAAGQGFRPSGAIPVGASGASERLQLLYRNSQAWKLSYKHSPKSACSAKNTANLCGAAATNVADAYAQITLATSPPVYSSLDPKYTSGVRLVAPPEDQQSCDTCSAFAIASAGETAMASALNVSATDCSISVQALYFCPKGKPARTCHAGWDFQGALTALEERGQELPTADCQPYKPDFRGVYSYKALCEPDCSSTNRYASQGQFSSSQIANMWEAQHHIRQYGSVVTRFDVYDDFKPYYGNKNNAKGVYKPRPGATFEFGHAVALVGYDNVNDYWLAKNSWGATWADGGYFRVAYGVCSVLTPGAEGVWGVVWTPNSTPVYSKLKVQPGPKQECYWYTAQPGDYLSKVAWKAGVPLDRFMLDNTDRVKDLDAPLAGVKLMLCNPSPDIIRKPGADGGGPDAQLEALSKIKASIDTTNVLQGWTRESGQGAGYCFWRSVTCSEDGVSLQQIFISDKNGVKGLVGSLPNAAVFGGLPKLESLAIIGQHGIKGSIPDWSNLTSLTELKIAGDGLTGTIPALLGNLTRLKTLYLWGNNLNGTLPGKLQGLKALEDVQMSFNSLTGTVPGWLGTLTRLQVLKLGQNMLTGTIPRSLSNLKRLRTLWLFDNPALRGCIPLDLQRQLAAVGTAQGKTNLMGGTQISGFCPPSGDPVMSVAPPSKRDPDLQLESLLKLRLALDLGGVLAGWNREAGLDGGYCDWLGVTCKKGTKVVERLIMWRETGVDGLKGTLPSAAALRGLTNITSISITSQPGLHGTLPDDWSTLTQLEGIRVSNTSVSGTIPSSYGKLTRLAIFYAWGCGLKGTIPSSFSQLHKLQILDVNSNRLTGGIPVWLGQLKSLAQLRLSRNVFGGSIPGTLGRLTGLQVLELNSNGLTGSIPESFGDLHELKELNLYNNRLRGTLPDSLSQLTRLESLIISKNSLSGTIPASYSKLTKLDLFYAWGNPSLQGCLPLAWKGQLTKVDLKDDVTGKTKLKGYC